MMGNAISLIYIYLMLLQDFTLKCLYIKDSCIYIIAWIIIMEFLMWQKTPKF